MRAKRNHPAIDDTRCKHGFRNHGGLTPAALVNVRLCIPKIAILLAHGHCYSIKSGGRKLPVANAACRCSETHICNSIRTRNQERGRQPPVANSPRSKLRSRLMTRNVPFTIPTAGLRPPLLFIGPIFAG
jgi:hypothetical protein